MLEDPTRPGTTSRGRDGRLVPAPARPSHAAAIQDLRRLRQRVAERLGALETLVRRREESPVVSEELEALERTLRRGMAEVEEARRQLRDEVERRQEEWNASLAQLDADRRSLAEAWERVERERIEGLGATGGQAPSQAHARLQGPPRGAPSATLRAVATAPARSAATDHDSHNPVAQAVLREFQTLSRDVRSNAAARREPS
jgi:hypothetical protein